LASGLLVAGHPYPDRLLDHQQASSWFTTEGGGSSGRFWNPRPNQFGALSFIYGTAITAAIALIIAVPVSVGVALLLTEVVPTGGRGRSCT